jgi:hypothetical protein
MLKAGGAQFQKEGTHIPNHRIGGKFQCADLALKQGIGGHGVLQAPPRANLMKKGFARWRHATHARYASAPPVELSAQPVVGAA